MSYDGVQEASQRSQPVETPDAYSPQPVVEEELT